MSTRKGHVVTTATREAISKALTGKKHPHKGHPMSAEAKAKLSASLKAAAARRKAAGIKIKRKPMTADARAKLSARMKAQAARRKALGLKIHRKPMTADQRAKLSAPDESGGGQTHTGATQSEGR